MHLVALVLTEFMYDCVVALLHFMYCWKVVKGRPENTNILSFPF